MDTSYELARIAGQVRQGAERLLEASHRACELQRVQLSTELLDLALQLDDKARDLLELPRKTSSQEDLLNTPF